MSSYATTHEIPASETVSFEDLRALAAAQHPCITFAVTIPDPVQAHTHIKNAVHEVKKRLHEARIDSGVAAQLMQPMQALGTGVEMEGIWSKSLVLFRSPDLFRAFWVGETMKDFVTVGERFQIRRLLSLVSREQRFYLLALSQKHVHLFRCTHHSAREIQLNGHVPTSLHGWRPTAKPDHVLDNRASAGPSVGSMKGVMFGTSTVREQQDEYLLHFFKQIDKGLHRLLVQEVAPLIIAGVEFEIALYRRVNTYHQLTEHAVHGSPDGLTPRELHEKALTFVKQTFSPALKRAMEDFEEYGGTKRASSSLDEILKAADEGRVADLLLREDAERRGNSPCEEDLLNLAALRTVSHRGQAFALKASEIPGQLDAAAVFRF